MNGEKCEAHGCLNKLKHSAEGMNGYFRSNLTVIQPSADPDLHGEYTGQFKVMLGLLQFDEVEISILALIRRPEPVHGHYS